MNRCTAFVLATVLWGLAPTPGFAQEAETATGRKNLIIAVVAETVFPVLGHSYAGHARRGIAPAVPLAAGYVLAAHAMWTDTVTTIHAVGAVSMLVGKVWGIVSVVSTVRDHNASLLVEPTPNRQVALGIRVNF
ncbi:MAG: hypothetical protein F4106_09115 [Gemmatimonadetes bacterium]|nr:hypothetical protein [Gemmatimonadota bacterium]MXX73398.1 hypothetical protein [Gemmatimonadota bacterium]MYC90171.1 hypothetical protein [Gemmatimonadota bacterium]MYG34760.1 hypothetical protein [Gemmatimonadota bacterium]MYJ18187.1 hypothetical protein [Gemmatimonadota bacterium]